MIEDLEVQDFNKQVIAPAYQSNFRAEHGKSTVDVECPFCLQTTNAYVWSLAGGGKRCGTCKDVLLTSINAFKRFKKAEDAVAFYEANK